LDGCNIVYDEESSVQYHDLDGTIHTTRNFSIKPYRNLCDVFMNTYSKAVSHVFGCNTNVQLGSYNHMFYTTLYSSKNNQEEEKQPFLNVCNAVAKRLKRMSNNPSANRSTSYGDGLGHVLSGIAAHISSFILSATMAWRISVVGSRFRFSHQFTPLLLRQVEDWIDDTGDIQFRIRRKCISNDDGDKEFISWLDSSLNNYIYRPKHRKFDNMCLWEFTSLYELKTKQIPFESKSELTEVDETDCNNFDEEYFLFDERHPGYKYAKLYQRKVPNIPILYMDGPFPHVSDLKVQDECQLSEYINEVRENYGKKAMLLFCPYHEKKDIIPDVSWWDAFLDAQQSGRLYIHYKTVLGNIQTLLDCQQNKTKLVFFDELERRTTLTQVDDDEEDNCIKTNRQQDDNYISSEAIECIIDGQMSSICENKISTNDVKPSYRDYINQELLITPEVMKGQILFQSNIVTNESNSTSQQQINAVTYARSNRYFGLIEVVMKCIPSLTNIDGSSQDVQNLHSNDVDYNNNNHALDIDSIGQFAKKKSLDSKQTVAFEVIVSSYILHCLNTNKALAFGKNDTTHSSYKKLSERLLKIGAKPQLIMFMTGPGGGGKSYVISAVIEYCKIFSMAAGITFDSNTFLLTACSNSAAFLINGRTIHSMCHLNSKQKSLIRLMKRCNWKDVRFIFIDEVSFFSSKDLMKLDKHLRILTGNRGMLYGGVHIIFVGDFFQLDPVSGQPIYGHDAFIHWKQAVNACIFLDGFHRFNGDPKWGEILYRLRMGELTEEDVREINSRVIGRNLTIPVDNKNVCYACSTNKQRNIVSDAVFENIAKGGIESNLEGCIIIKSKICDKKHNQFSNTFHNLVYRKCGDSLCTGSKVHTRVDPCLKLYKGCPIMFTLNSDVEDSNTYCKGMTGKFEGVILKEGKSVKNETFSGISLSSVFVDDLEAILVQIDGCSQSLIKVHPVEQTVSIDIPFEASCTARTRINGLKLTQLPIVCNIATTGHKLQGTTKEKIVVIDFNYGLRNWIYLVLSRVTSLAGLFLKKPLDFNKLKGPSRELLIEMKRLKCLEEELIHMRNFVEAVNYVDNMEIEIWSIDKHDLQEEKQSHDELYAIHQDMFTMKNIFVPKFENCLRKELNETVCQEKKRSVQRKSRNVARNIVQNKKSTKAKIQNTDKLFFVNEKYSSLSQFCDINGAPDTILFRHADASIQRQSFMTLAQGTWLVDEVINYYMSLLNDLHWYIIDLTYPGRCPYALKSFFLTLLCSDGRYNINRVVNWTLPEYDITAYSHIVCPLNINNVHWALIYADFEKVTIYFLDSLRCTDATHYMLCFRQYLIDIHIGTYGVENIPQWKLEYVHNCAQQQNSYDCGIFACMFAYCIMTGHSIPDAFPNSSSRRLTIAQSIQQGRVFPLFNS
jgi:hypothetical protein